MVESVDFADCSEGRCPLFADRAFVEVDLLEVLLFLSQGLLDCLEEILHLPDAVWIAGALDVADWAG